MSCAFSICQPAVVCRAILRRICYYFCLHNVLQICSKPAFSIAQNFIKHGSPVFRKLTFHGCYRHLLSMLCPCVPLFPLRSEACIVWTCIASIGFRLGALPWLMVIGPNRVPVGDVVDRICASSGSLRRLLPQGDAPYADTEVVLLCSLTPFAS